MLLQVVSIYFRKALYMEDSTMHHPATNATVYPQFNPKRKKINKFIQLFMQQHTQKHQSVTMLRLGRYILITVCYLFGFHPPNLTLLHT